MASKVLASIVTRSEEIRKDVRVERITPVGIVIHEGDIDNTIDVLIPWHRVWEVYSFHESELLNAL